MVLFRREFSFADTLYLWEVWDPNHILVGLDTGPFLFFSRLRSLMNLHDCFCQSAEHNKILLWFLWFYLLGSCAFGVIHWVVCHPLQMMWALEYTPLSIQDVSTTRGWTLRRKYKGRGKFEAQNEKYGASRVPGGNAPLALFCAVSIFEMQRHRLLKETQGLDEVLKVSIP